MPHLDGPFSGPFIYSRLRLPLAYAIIYSGLRNKKPPEITSGGCVFFLLK